MNNRQIPTQNNGIEPFPELPEDGYSYAGKDDLDEEPGITAQYKAPEGFKFEFGYDENRKRWGHLLVPLDAKASENLAEYDQERDSHDEREKINHSAMNTAKLPETFMQNLFPKDRNQVWAPSTPSKPIDVQTIQALPKNDAKPRVLQSTGPRTQIPQPQMFFSVSSPSNSPTNSPTMVRKADRVEINFNHDSTDKTNSMDIDTPKLNG